MQHRDPFADLRDDLDQAPVTQGNFTEIEQRMTAYMRTPEGKEELSSWEQAALKAKRRAAWIKGEETRKHNIAKRASDWMANYPAEFAWLRANNLKFEFATSLYDSLFKFGSLTDNQLLAVRKCLARDTAPRDKPLATTSVAGVGFTKLVECFNRASKVLKHPALEVHRDGRLFCFKPAKAESKNPGCIYVNVDSTYIGKIESNGGFFPTRNCVSDVHAQVLDIGRDPIAAAVASGHATGRCAICSRRLDNEESLARGIGPVCAERFFGG